MSLGQKFSTVIALVALAVGMAGCGNSNEMSQEEVQYLGHLDQAKFYRKQGELKASTLEARNAIAIQPEEAKPYLLIIRNMLSAGDALNAERQLIKLLENIPKSSMPLKEANEASLIRSEASLLQGHHEAALNALSDLQSPDLEAQFGAAQLTGRIHLANNSLKQAEMAFLEAQTLDNNSALPLVGLSRVAFAQNDPDLVQQLINGAEKLNPNEPDLWLWKAQLAHLEKNFPVAEDAYIRALEDIGQFDVMTYRKYQTISALIDVLRSQGKSSEAFVYEEVLAKSGPGTIKANLTAASEAYNDGDLTDASRYLEEILTLAPGHTQSTLMLGIIRFRQGRMGEAEALLTPIVEQSDTDGPKKLLAATRLQLRDIVGANEILNDLSDRHQDPEALALVGIVSLANGEMQSGRQLIEKSLALNPDNHELRLRFVSFLIRNGDFELAEQQANLLLSDESHSDQGRMLLIQLHVLRGDLPSATRMAEAWLKESSNSVNALISRGKIAATSGHTTEAMDYFDEALKNRSQDAASLVAESYHAMAMAELENGSTEKAFAILSRGKALLPNNQKIGLQTAILAFREGNNQEALETLNDLKQRHPNSSRPLIVEAAFLSSENRHQEAAETLSLALAKERSASTELAYARALQRAGNVGEALAALKASLEAFPGEPQLMNDLAMLYQATEREEEAIFAYEQVLEHSHNNALALNNLAWLYHKKSDSRALDLARRAFELTPGNASIADTYGWIMFKTGEVQDGLQLLEQAHALEPHSKEIALHLAEAYRATNQPQKAQQVLKAQETEN